MENTNIRLSFGGDDNGNESGCTIDVEIIDGKKEGRGIVYSSRNLRIANLNFLHDQLHGICTFNDDSGRLQKEAYYEHGVLRYVDYYENGNVLHKYEFDGTLMREYEMRPAQSLIYEGEYKGDINTGFMREGSGCLYLEGLNIGTFENNQIVSILNISESTLYEYDEGKIVYIGEYKGNMKEGFYRSGKGVVFTYANETVSSAYRVVNGKQVSLYLSFPTVDTMCEYNEDGAMVYKGGFSKNNRNLFIRCGKGEEYDNNKYLVYSGEWKENKRSGKGMYYAERQLRFEGEWNQGYPVSGKYFDEEGKVLAEGEWDHGFYPLDGKIYLDYRDGQKVSIDENYQVIYKGEWEDGKPHGQGSYYEDGKLKFSGLWTEGYIHARGPFWFNYVNDKEEVQFVRWLIMMLANVIRFILYTILYAILTIIDVVFFWRIPKGKEFSYKSK